MQWSKKYIKKASGFSHSGKGAKSNANSVCELLILPASYFFS